MLQPYKVRDIEIKNGLVLSPMSGVTTRAFRTLVKELNGDALGLTVSEFISVEALTRKVQKSLDMMRFDKSESPYCVQIFGYDIERMCESAKMVEDVGADIVDINCGCPAPKVVRKGGGCELMRQPEHLAKIISSVRKAVSIPVTVKIRSGWSETTKNALEIAKMAEEQGAEALAIHGRTRQQMYRGDADWDLVSEVAQELKIPVLGSGDVIDLRSAEERLKTGIAGIFVGRGAIKNPFIFRDIIDGRDCSDARSPIELLEVLQRYIDILIIDMPELNTCGKIKQLVSQMGKGNSWRKRICTSMSLDEIRQILREEIENESLKLQMVA